MRRLIVNADDFGLADGVERGILEAHADGCVTSTSVIVNGPAWARTADRLRSAAPTLGLGLHFNVVTGAPLERVTTLTDRRTGLFTSLPGLAARAWTGRVDRDEVQAECAAQLARLAAAGVHITHVDSHRHAHVLPGCWSAVVAAAREAGVRIVRIPRERVGLNVTVLEATAKKALLALSSRLAAVGGPPVEHADHFIGISLQGLADFGTRLAQVLERLPSGTTELLVHPGYVDDELRRRDGYLDPRERELAALRSARVRELLHNEGIALIHFGRL